MEESLPAEGPAQPMAERRDTVRWGWLVSGQSWNSGHHRMEDEAGRWSWGQAGRGPVCHTRVNVEGTHRWKGKKGDADQGEGGRNQTALPRLGCLVPVADGGQCDLK